MKTKIQAAIAVFVALLIIMIPFTSAASLSIIRNSGDDNVEGFIDALGDMWHLVVNAQPDSGEVAPQQIKVNGYSFQSCSAAPSPRIGYDCKYEYTFSSLSEGIWPIEIKLYDSSLQSVLQTISSTTTSDGSAPEIKSVSAQQMGKKVKVEYTIRDLPKDACSGISGVEFYDVYTKADETHPNITDCNVHTISDIINFPTSGTANKTVKLIAYDKLGHSTEAVVSAPVLIDNTKPIIIDFGIKVGDKFYNTNYIPGGSYNANLVIYIADDSGMANVTAQLPAQMLVTSDCARNEQNTLVCVFAAKPISELVIGGSISFTAAATDYFDNSATKSFSRTYSVDNIPPQITFFGTQATYNEVNYIGQYNNTIRVEFEEAGSGIDRNDVELDLSAVTLVPADYRKPDSCTQKGTIWTCIWTNINSELGDRQSRDIQLTKAKDLAGNSAGSHTATLVMTTSAPVVQSILVEGVGATGRVPYVQEGMDISVKAAIQHKIPVKAAADFSSVAANAENLQGTCTAATAGIWECMFNVNDAASVSAAQEFPATFTFTDFAGNSV
ncbi:MAG: hypothetical protein QXH80_03390, partial [Candidatus Nanoarchaeia archaeon]